jgi:hypothetical protein
MKNPKWKKQISVYKFRRIAKNAGSIKVKGLYSSAVHIPEVEQSFEAYEMDGFLYMFRKCRKQKGNRLKTYFARYIIGHVETNKEYAITGGRV